MTNAQQSKPWLWMIGLVCAVSIAPAANAGANITNGKYIYNAADCIGCHAGNGSSSLPSGGLSLDTPFGTFRVPNITPDKRFGIGNWSEADFKRALREGVGKQGEYLFPVFPYPSFSKLSDSDIADLYAYMMTLPAVPAPNKPHEVKPPFNWRPLLFFWRTLFFDSDLKKAPPVRDAAWSRGNYLVHAVAHCEECHTPRNVMGGLKTSLAFSGNVGGPDGQNAPNITSDVSTGIGGWSVADIQNLLKTGMTPDSDLVGSGMKAVVRGTSKLSDADLRAMAVYLKSVPPIHIEPIPKPASKAP
ncbi:cytochrome c [Herbaspirillum sp. RV1423]|uniref:c-type cytochrome n=1 Tax=Herbaspirillum sp. RV1423 TaxID=1443993 RepID=UPI0006886E41|nr:cytochrome c [Herbaspirillum sp. RV1423]